MAEVYTVNINTSGAVKSIATLEKELQETTEQLKQVAVGSDAFNALQRKAADCKGQIDQFNRATDTLSKGFQGWGENAAKMTSGITGGITAATAAMQMMGVENDNVMEGIAKLQQLMAFSQGISSLKDLSEGFKNMKAAVKVATGSLHGLKGAIVATGIGALVVALGLLVANWDKVTEAVDGFIGKAGEASKMTAALDGFFAGLKQSVMAVGNAIVQYVTAPFKTIVAAIKAYNDEEGNFFEKIKAAAGAGKAAIVDAGKSTVEGFRKVGVQAATAYNNSIDEQNKAAESKRKEDAKKAADERAKAAAEAYNKAHQAAQAALQLANAQAEVELYGDEDAITQRKIDNYKTYLATLKEGSLEWYNTRKTIMDMEASLLDEEVANEQAATEEVKKTNEEKTKDAEKTVEELRELHMQQASTLMNSIASSMTSVFDAIADTADTNTKEGFEKSKKMQIASATVNMLAGISNAWMSAMSPMNEYLTLPGQIALGLAETVATAATGAAQIAKIRATTFDGGSSSSSSLSSAATSSTLVAPTQYSSAVNAANIESTIADTRVYVVESDIQQTGTRVRTQERENRY
jgi:hypothetical protein